MLIFDRHAAHQAEPAEATAAPRRSTDCVAARVWSVRGVPRLATDATVKRPAVRWVAVLVFVADCILILAWSRRQPPILRQVCTYELPPAIAFQSVPVVAGNRIVVTLPDETHAIDARTCARVWRVDHHVSGDAWLANRGAVLADGAVIRGMPDGWLIALDLVSGSERWRRQVADPSRNEALTMQPAVLDSLVFIGPAGSEDAVHGWIGAFRIRDGTPIWRFDTLEPSTWEGAAPAGGSVWTRFSVDSVNSVVYAATTNPSPDFAPEQRPGSNLYTNSLIALDARTGRLRWYRQLVPNDFHDWDLTQAGPLVGGLIIAAGKDGIVRGLRTVDGEVAWQTPVARQENTTAPVTESGTHVCPGGFGGVMWSTPAHSTSAGLVYVPSVDICGTFYRDSTEGGGLGGYFRPDSVRTGSLTAIDPRTGVIRWRYQSAAPMLAGVVALGDLVITGEMRGDVIAFDAATGRVRERHRIGPQVGAGIAAYAVGGRRYLAALSGSVSPIVPLSHWGVPRVTIFELTRASR